MLELASIIHEIAEGGMIIFHGAQAHLSTCNIAPSRAVTELKKKVKRRPVTVGACSGCYRPPVSWGQHVKRGSEPFLSLVAIIRPLLVKRFQSLFGIIATLLRV